MAPNLKQRPLILQTAADIPIKAAFPPLTSEVTQSNEISETAAVQNIPQSSNSYWEWSADNDAEIQKLTAEEEAARLVSAEHIVDNIRQQSVAKASSTSAANDQYWD